jgi:hypothetical protein
VSADCAICQAQLSPSKPGTICRECAMTVREPLKRRRAYPKCHICGEPCVAGQRDRRGRSAHYGCQMAHLRPALRDPRLPENATSFGPRWEDREKENTA